MFQQLQDYLFRYKTVAIPGVGTFAVTEQPATLDVASQLLLPPSYAIRFLPQAEVPRHQLQTLAAAFDNNTDSAEAALAGFSEAFLQQLEQHAFDWQGIGSLRVHDARVQFTPAASGSLLAPSTALRVLRENVEHTVLVGDQEMRYTAEAYEASLAVAPKRDWFVITGWIIAALALVFLAYHLYNSKFAPTATGLQVRPEVKEMPRQYRQ